MLVALLIKFYLARQELRVAITNEVETRLDTIEMARELELSERGMPLSVATLEGRHHHLVVLPDDSVGKVKELIAKRTQIATNTQSLRLPGSNVLLSDSALLSGAGIGPNAELHLVVRVVRVQEQE